MRFLFTVTACATLALTQQTLPPHLRTKPEPAEMISSNIVQKTSEPEEKYFPDKQAIDFKEKHNGDFDHQKFGRIENSPDERMDNVEQEIVPLPGELHKEDKDDKEKEKNKQKERERNHIFYVAGFAIFFTLFGLLLGKCIRKCQNKGGKHPKKNERNFEDLEEEIRENEKRLYNLKQEYSLKKLEEFKKNEENQKINNLKKGYIQPQQPQYADPYYQPINYAQPVHQQDYYQNYGPSTVPVGRRLNESTNSDYAQDYPHV